LNFSPHTRGVAKVVTIVIPTDVALRQRETDNTQITVDFILRLEQENFTLSWRKERGPRSTENPQNPPYCQWRIGSEVLHRDGVCGCGILVPKFDKATDTTALKPGSNLCINVHDDKICSFVYFSDRCQGMEAVGRVPPSAMKSFEILFSVCSRMLLLVSWN